MLRSQTSRWAICSSVALALVLVLALPAASQGSLAPRRPVSAEVAARAAEEALAYARVSYPAGNGTQEGMPFKLGGQTTLLQFLQRVQEGADPRSMGVDASGLVVNVYRTVIPGLTFLVQAGSSGLAETDDATSAAIFYWNVDAVDLSAAVPGDLLFFKSATGEPSGVAVVTGIAPERVDFVVASAREGRVIESFARPGGSYWQANVLGLGRLLVPERVEASL